MTTDTWRDRVVPWLLLPFFLVVATVGMVALWVVLTVRRLLVGPPAAPPPPDAATTPGAPPAA